MRSLTSLRLRPATIARYGRTDRRCCRVHARSRRDTSELAARKARCSESIVFRDTAELAEKTSGVGSSVSATDRSEDCLSRVYSSRMACAFVPPNPKLFMLARLTRAAAGMGHAMDALGISRCE